MDNIIKKNRQEIKRIALKHGARNIKIFGSQARDEATPSSDVDFLVELESGASLLDIIAIKQDLEDLLGYKVDVITERAISPYLKEHVLKEAIAL